MNYKALQAYAPVATQETGLPQYDTQTHVITSGAEPHHMYGSISLVNVTSLYVSMAVVVEMVHIKVEMVHITPQPWPVDLLALA